jgi:hypothetical protein
MECLHDRRDLLRVGGEDHGSWGPSIRGEPVGFVDQEAIRIRDDVLPAHDIAELALESDGEGLGHLRTGLTGGHRRPPEDRPLPPLAATGRP